MQGHMGKPPCWSGGRRQAGTTGMSLYCVFFIGRDDKAGLAGLGVASLDHCSRLWGAGAVPTSPVLGPRRQGRGGGLNVRA